MKLTEQLVEKKDLATRVVSNYIRTKLSFERLFRENFGRSISTQERKRSSPPMPTSETEAKEVQSDDEDADGSEELASERTWKIVMCVGKSHDFFGSEISKLYLITRNYHPPFDNVCFD